MQKDPPVETEKRPGEGHPWADFLHHRARVIDWLYTGESNPMCKGSDWQIARVLSMDAEQVRLIRTRERGTT